jgi:type I restriction-modification system DNA methylase subunit
MNSIKKLVSKYQKNRNEYLKSNYNEAQLRSEFIDPLFELLGWDIKNIQGKSTYEREVILEESVKMDKETNSKKPDYTFRLFSERKFFVEAKKPSIEIQKRIEDAKQLRKYGFTSRLKISILTNFEYFLIFDCSVIVSENDSLEKALIKKYHYTEFIKKFYELNSLIGKTAVYSGEFDKQWSDIETKLKTKSVDTLFLTQINRWRLMLGNEILKYEPKIKMDFLNDIVQNYINRIIFLRVCEDRNLETYKSLLTFSNDANFDALIKKFKSADKKYNSGLFDQILSDELIKNVSSIFWVIIRELYYPESPYSYSVFSSEILGNIYEIFISEKLNKKHKKLVIESKQKNIDKDIITTPIFIIRDILRQTVIPYCKGMTDKEILSKSFADIACGSGAFLLETFQLLSDLLIDFYLLNDKSKLIQLSIGNYKLPFEIKKELLTQCIYGVDIDYNAIEAAKFGLLLKLLENESFDTLGKVKPILPSLKNNIERGNSLISSSDLRSKNNKIIEEIAPYDFKMKFDIIIGNPPYSKSEDMKSSNKTEFDIYKRKFKTSNKQYDKYFLFIERSIELLKDNGYIGYIVPSKFTKVGSASELRSLLSSNKYINRFISFGANQIFQSKTTYTSLLILCKSFSEKFKYIEVKSLKSWLVRDISTDKFDEIEHKLLNNDGWILVPSKLEELFSNISNQSESLEDIVGTEGISNGIQTSANDIYIINVSKVDEKYLYFAKNGKYWKIEKQLTRPYFHTTKGNDNLFTYRPFEPNSFVIYPYKKVEDKIELIGLTVLKKDFPFLYKYLSYYKNELSNPKRDIKPEPKTINEWYRFGRHQALDKCEVPEKIIVGVLSQGNKYAIDFNQTLISSGGTAGYCMITLPKNSPYSIYYIQAILNSKYVEWYCSLIGEVFRGGFIARGTKVLKKLPIRKIDFKNKKDKRLHNEIVKAQRRMISLQKKIDKNYRNERIKNSVEKQFELENLELDKMLKELYGLGKEDNKIPLIKDIYASN